MPDPLGPPAPPTALKGWNELRHTAQVKIPRSLNRTRHGILKLRQIGRLR